MTSSTRPPLAIPTGRSGFRVRASWRLAAFALLVVLGADATASAQDGSPAVERRVRAEGYGFAGQSWLSQKVCPEIVGCPDPFWGDRQPLLNFGGGVEVHLTKGIGLSTDAQLVERFEPFGAGAGLLFSLNGTYVMDAGPSVHPRLSPFVTAGYTAGGFGSGHAVNVGAGIKVWGNRRAALRVETRGHLWTNNRVLDLRIGFSVRPR